MNMQTVQPNLSAVEETIGEFLATLSIDVGEQQQLSHVKLLDGDVLDSLGIVQLTMFLADEFDIEITDEDFEPENFDTVGRLARLIHVKKLGSV